MPRQAQLGPAGGHETHHVCHIVDHNDAVGAAVVAGRDGAEALLASRVPLPGGRKGSASDWAETKRLHTRHGAGWHGTAVAYNLQLDGLAVKLNGANFLWRRQVRGEWASG